MDTLECRLSERSLVLIDGHAAINSAVRGS